MLFSIFTKAAQVITILSMRATFVSAGASPFKDLTNLIGIGPSRMWNLVFIDPMTRSTWILILVMSLDFSTSLAGSWVLPFINEGVINSAFTSEAKSSCRVNPLSAST